MRRQTLGPRRHRALRRRESEARDKRDAVGRVAADWAVMKEACGSDGRSAARAPGPAETVDPATS